MEYGSSANNFEDLYLFKRMNKLIGKLQQESVYWGHTECDNWQLSTVRTGTAQLIGVTAHTGAECKGTRHRDVYVGREERSRRDMGVPLMELLGKHRGRI